MQERDVIKRVFGISALAHFERLSKLCAGNLRILKERSEKDISDLCQYDEMYLGSLQLHALPTHERQALGGRKIIL